MTNNVKNTNGIEQRFNRIEEKLDKNTAILLSIESRLSGFADAWKVNRQRLGRLQKRVIKIENHLGLPSTQEIV